MYEVTDTELSQMGIICKEKKISVTNGTVTNVNVFVWERSLGPKDI